MPRWPWWISPFAMLVTGAIICRAAWPDYELEFGFGAGFMAAAPLVAFANYQYAKLRGG